jgi:hypothetical protein
MFNSLRQRRRKLTAEPLEVRALLTAYFVNTLADNPLGIATDTDGFVSLRAA